MLGTIETEVTIINADAGPFTAPSTSSHGVALRSGNAPAEHLIRFSADGALTVSAPTLYGYLNGAWSLLEVLSTDDLLLTATLGRDFRVKTLGAYERVAITATLAGGNDLTVVATGIQDV